MAKKSKATLPVASAVSVKQSMESKAQERRWRAEDALRSIQRANEVKQDKGLMKDVKALLKEQEKAVNRFCK